MIFAWNGKDRHVVKQFSQVPYLELKLPPPLCCACSEITVRAQTSQVLAISPRDIGCDRLRKDMLNLDFAFTERSSFSLLKGIFKIILLNARTLGTFNINYS